MGEPLDVEGYPQAPSGLDLEQVHIYVRHGVSRVHLLIPFTHLALVFLGERTPVSTRMADPPASIPEYWQMCSVVRRFREAVNSTTTTTLSEPYHDGVWFKRGTETRDGRTFANLWYANIRYEKPWF